MSEPEIVHEVRYVRERDYDTVLGMEVRELPFITTARSTDPVTSHEAAAAVKPAENDIQQAIRQALDRAGHSLTAEEIAASVCAWTPGRWLPATIVSACAPKRTKGRLVVSGYSTNDRGRRVQLLRLP